MLEHQGSWGAQHEADTPPPIGLPASIQPLWVWFLRFIDCLIFFQLGNRSILLIIVSDYCENFQRTIANKATPFISDLCLFPLLRGNIVNIFAMYFSRFLDVGKYFFKKHKWDYIAHGSLRSLFTGSIKDIFSDQEYLDSPSPLSE